MWIVKSFDSVALEWVFLAFFPTLDEAEMYQDRVWLDFPDVITEIENRGF